MGMGTPDGIGYIALFCITAPICALLLYWLIKAVGSLRSGDRRSALRYAIALTALLVLITALTIGIYS